MVKPYLISKEYQLSQIDYNLDKGVYKDAIQEIIINIQVEQLRALQVISAQLEEIYMSIPEGK